MMKRIDTGLILSIILLVSAGYLVFVSASLGLLAREADHYANIMSNQTLSIVLGIAGMIAVSFIPLRKYRKAIFWFFLGSLFINLLVFIPDISLTHNGATRWLLIGSFSFQPSEFLKIAYIMYLAAWLQASREDLATTKWGLMPYLVITGLIGIAIVGAQSDTDTFLVIAGTGFFMLFIAGIPLRKLAIIAIIGLIGLGGIIASKPYIIERIKTFLTPNAAIQEGGYQIRQSLIAIGSGGIDGRGFGQSVQKFNYLPEPVGDSIFAVFGEEFGFIGSIVLLSFYLFFAFRGLRVGKRAKDPWAGLVVSGIVILIIIESFMNIAALSGLIPLSGMPLIFISHGGTSIAVMLASLGIMIRTAYESRGVKQLS